MIYGAAASYTLDFRSAMFILWIQTVDIIHSPFQAVQGTPIDPGVAEDIAGSAKVFPHFSIS
jgi:hypothetical protein